MKNTLLLTLSLLAFTTLTSSAQSDSIVKPLTFTEVVEVDPATTKAQLFTAAQQWFASAFKDSKEVLNIQDKDAGLLVGKGTIKFDPKSMGGATSAGYVTFEIKIQVKDGKYKYEMTNFDHKGSKYYSASVGTLPATDFGIVTTATDNPLNTGMGKKQRQEIWEELKAHINTTAAGLIVSIKKAMIATPAKDDW